MKPHVRIGDRFYLLAGDRGRELLGLPARRRQHRALTARTAADIAGGQGAENPQEDDLRWLLTSWSAGEGQKVLVAGDDISERRFDRSQGVDLSDPGRIRLNRAMRRSAVTSSVGTTDVEGASFSTLSGSSTVAGSDRTLDSDGATVGYSVSLTAGQHQVDFHGYGAPSASVFTVEGNQFQVRQGGGGAQGSDLVLHIGNKPFAYATFSGQAGLSVLHEVTFWIQGRRSDPAKGRQCSVKVKVRNSDDSQTITEKHATLFSGQGHYDALVPITVSFAARAGTSYIFRVDLSADTLKGEGIIIGHVSTTVHTPSYLELSAYQGASLLAMQTVEVTNITATRHLASLTFTLPSTQNVSIRMKRVNTPLHSLVADKVTYTDAVSLAHSYNCELGQGGRVWLVDKDAAGAASIYVWDGAEWDAVANIGPNGAACYALAHSDSYEYVLLSNGTVYRSTTASATAYTDADTARVGVAVGADRLWVLRESAAGGTVLERAALDATAGLPLAPEDVYTAVAQGVTPDTTMVRRVAGTPFGAVFFVNRSTGCEVFEWNEGTQAGRSVGRIEGFRARAVAHGGGYTWLAGELAVSGGGTKAAMFVIDHAAAPAGVEPVSVPLERDGEADSYIQDIQIYGEDIFLGAHQVGPNLRLWRLSTKAPGGLFLEHQVAEGAGATMRAIAVDHDTRVMASDSGGPWLAQEEYLSDGSAFLRSSLYNFRLLDQKALTEITVDGQFPPGTRAEVRYALDGSEDYTSAGVFTASGTKLVATTEVPVFFRSLSLEIRPSTTDPNATPDIYSVEAKASLSAAEGGGGIERTFELVLYCGRQTSAIHIDGQGRGGPESARYIFDLAAAKQIVEFEDFYGDPEVVDSHLVQVRDPDEHSIGPGESLVRVQLVEKG